MGDGLILAIDPGAEHCGWCLADDRPFAAGVLPPVEMYGFVEECFRWRPDENPPVEELVIEEYRVLDDSANRYATAETAEVIGVLKYLAGRAAVAVIMQQPAIKKPMKGWLLGHGEASVVPRTLGDLRIHAVDAELHAWYRLRRKEEDGRT